MRREFGRGGGDARGTRVQRHREFDRRGVIVARERETRGRDVETAAAEPVVAAQLSARRVEFVVRCG